MAVPSPTERINALERAVARLDSTTDRLRKELDDAIAQEAKSGERNRLHVMWDEQFDDHTRRLKLAYKCLWGLIVAADIAALTFVLVYI